MSSANRSCFQLSLIGCSGFLWHYFPFPPLSFWLRKHLAYGCCRERMSESNEVEPASLFLGPWAFLSHCWEAAALSFLWTRSWPQCCIHLSTLALVSRSFPRWEPECSDCDPQIRALHFLPPLDFYSLKTHSFNVGHHECIKGDASAGIWLCTTIIDRYYSG